MRAIGLAPKTLSRHIQRQSEELLSSWLVALARQNGCKVHTLCTRIGGNQHTIWNRDIDRSASEEVLRRLAELTALEVADIRQATLADLAEKINPEHRINGDCAWILPLGIWHRKRRSFGVQFCPICLRLDPRPFVRRAWRLAYYTECEHHRVLLMDRCPSCGRPFVYFRGEMGDRNQIEAPPIGICSHCGNDLAYEPPQLQFEWPDWRITTAVRTLQFMAPLGWALLQERTFDPAHQLLLVIRQMIKVMSSRRRSGQLFDAVAARIWPYGYEVLRDRGMPYERRPTLDRHRLFGMAVWLLQEWPDRFEQVFHEANIPRFALTQEMAAVPRWYAEQCAAAWSA